MFYVHQRLWSAHRPGWDSRGILDPQCVCVNNDLEKNSYMLSQNIKSNCHSIPSRKYSLPQNYNVLCYWNKSIIMFIAMCMNIGVLPLTVQNGTRNFGWSIYIHISKLPFSFLFQYQLGIKTIRDISCTVSTYFLLFLAYWHQEAWTNGCRM